MSGKLSTHVLDTAGGRPAAGVPLELRRINGDAEELVLETKTNADGRTDGPLLSGSELSAGDYRIVFGVEAYFSAQGHPDAGAFLGRVVVDFRVSDPDAGYHVPLLVSPWSYTTYRGS